jgi:hypothetical protein
MDEVFAPFTHAVLHPYPARSLTLRPLADSEGADGESRSLNCQRRKSRPLSSPRPSPQADPLAKTTSQGAAGSH